MSQEGLTVAEAAERLGVSRQRVHKLLQEGKLRQLERREPVRDSKGKIARGGILLDPSSVEARQT